MIAIFILKILIIKINQIYILLFFHNLKITKLLIFQTFLFNQFIVTVHFLLSFK